MMWTDGLVYFAPLNGGAVFHRGRQHERDLLWFGSDKVAAALTDENSRYSRGHDLRWRLHRSVHRTVVTEPIPWFTSGDAFTDHLLRECPALRRSSVYGPIHQSGPSTFELPDAYGDVCGWCARVWVARNRPENAATAVGAGTRTTAVN